MTYGLLAQRSPPPVQQPPPTIQEDQFLWKLASVVSTKVFTEISAGDKSGQPSKELFGGFFTHISVPADHFIFSAEACKLTAFTDRQLTDSSLEFREGRDSVAARVQNLTERLGFRLVPGLTFLQGQI